MADPHKFRLCILVTAPTTLLGLYRGQFEFLLKQGFDVTVVSAPGEAHESLRARGLNVHAIAMHREPKPLHDLRSLFQIWKFFRTHQFDVVHVSTPKAGLLGAIAARLAGVRVLFFTLRGRTYENQTGIKRRFYSALDGLTCRLADVVIPICRELGESVVGEGVCSPEKIRFLGHGSSNGIDLRRFARSEQTEKQAIRFREKLGISPRDVIVLFVGRIRHDKGVDELVEACRPLVKDHRAAHLVLVGPREDVDPLSPETDRTLKCDPRMHVVPEMIDPEVAFWSGDIVVMPSHREGFGNVALEAGAAGLPVIGFDVIGLREAIADGESGVLVPLGDVRALRDAIVDLIENPAKSRQLGRQGHARVQDLFRQEVIWRQLVELYSEFAPPQIDAPMNAIKHVAS